MPKTCSRYLKKGGILNPTTGARYRHAVLAKGGTVDELNMVKEFLGRDPNPDAFFKSLGVQVGF